MEGLAHHNRESPPDSEINKGDIQLDQLSAKALAWSAIFDCFILGEPCFASRYHSWRGVIPDS